LIEYSSQRDVECTVAALEVLVAVILLDDQHSIGKKTGNIQDISEAIINCMGSSEICEMPGLAVLMALRNQGAATVAQSFKNRREPLDHVYLLMKDKAPDFYQEIFP
jgi:hypothetical protein